MDTDTDILIIGGGPTGLAAACEAKRHGLSVRIIERQSARATLSKALVVHARTMEVLEVMGCAQQVLTAGQRFRALNIRPAVGAAPVRVDLLNRAWGDTKYPFWLSVPQYEVERVLERRLEALGGRLEWSTTLVGLSQTQTHVEATLTAPDGSLVTHRARWLLACDGGRSEARALAGLALERQGLGVTFALADVKTRCELVEDEGHVVLSRDGVLLVVPMPEPGLWRLIAQVPADFDAASQAAWTTVTRQRLGVDLGIHALGWTSRFDLTGGVANHFRAGRVFLLGDAAHVHSPVGGQGLNTGVQDAHNLVWKLALVEQQRLSRREGERLLDSYERERRPIAANMVRLTTVATRLITLTNPVARAVRGLVARALLRLPVFANRLSRGVGMLDLKTDGAPRLENPEVSPGRRLHDLVDPTRPTRLRWKGSELLVRPDRVVVTNELISPALAVQVEVHQ
ncbi:MAG: FAD-dependent monooxygenase [Myxococcaceae bacterium]|nr:FAD-dependent monooxygenase [Myxococcaceae bacterium]